MPSQPLRAGELGTIANAIAFRFPECVAIGDDPRDGGLVHRLDIGTSGVLIAARTLDAYRALRAAFGAGMVVKHYLAITDGRPVARECDAPLAQRGKRVVVDLADGLPAYTEIERRARRCPATRWSAASPAPAGCTRSAPTSRTSARRSPATRCTAARRCPATTASSSTPRRSRCRSAASS